MSYHSNLDSRKSSIKSKIHFFLLLLLLPFCASAQPYGNEWINHNNQHYFFKISETGWYRLTYETLNNLGVPLDNISPDQFKIFGKEREQPIRVELGNDNSFDFGDYIEFYAESNDGWLDSLLFTEPDKLSNPAYSYYNDTLCYFFTWGSGISKRYVNETDVNFSGFSPRPFVIQRSEVSYNNQYHAGFSINNAQSSFFQPGEGWGSNNFNGANNFSLTIPVSTPSPFTGSGAPQVKFHAKSSANSNASFTGTGNHHLRWEVGSSNTLLFDDIFIGYRQTIAENEFSPNLLDNTTNVFFRIIGDQGAATDFQSVNYLYLEYPRTTNMNGANAADFWLENTTSAAKSLLEFTNTSFTNPECYVLGGGVSRRIPIVESGGVWRCLIPNSINGQRQRVIVRSSNQIKQVTSMQPVNGNGFFTNYTNLNLEEAFIMIYHPSMESSATQYRNYRTSPAGGGHNAQLFNVEELYLQFGGGVQKHVLGVRRLAEFIYNFSVEKPTGLFILGKGIREANEPNTLTGPGTRKNVTSYANSLIPSYGYPSSDVCITARFDNDNSWAPKIPTGRISARNNQELIAYLNKVQVYEANQDQTSTYNKPLKEWQKQVLHFGGGANANEQQTFRNYLNNMKTRVEGPKYGGHVTSFFKDNSNPFNPVLNSEVSGFLQDGVSLMTFFGHASATGFDQNIDDPENWGNTGKYPMVVGNSCYTGDIFQPTNTSASERFVLIPELGSIGFMSSTKLGFSSFLNIYTSEFYRQFSQQNYGKPIAYQQIETIRAIEGQNTNFILESTVTQMTLHGDPAIKLNWHKLPEIDLTNQDIFFEPTQFDLSTDSLTVNVVLTNLGQSITEPFSLQIRRNFPSSDVDSVYLFSIDGLNYKDTFQLRLPVQPTIGIGVNSFNIQADIPSFIDEIYDEFGNNEVTVDLFIDVDGINPVLPYNYAVVPNDSVVLKASTINPIAGFNTYRFEIDTTDLFNSNFKKYALVSGFGGVKEVFPNDWRRVSNNVIDPLVLEDSMAYFWRVAVDSVEPIWREHSFQYIKGKEGWGQDHFYQFKNGGFNGINYNRDVRQREFDPVNILLECDVWDNASTNDQYFQTLYKMNGEIVDYGACGATQSIHVAVIDPLNFEPWFSYFNGQNPQNQFGNANNGNACRSRPDGYFIFRQNSVQQLQALDDMLNNAIPDGYYVLVYTMRSANYTNWQNLYPDLFNTFENMGSEGISPGSPERAFIFFTQKGNSSMTLETFAQTSGEFISLGVNLEGVQSRGVERSTVIGPALKWNTLYWKQDPLEDPSFDETTLSIRALDASRTFQFQIDTTFTRNDSIVNLNNLIPAEQYPFLQLQATYKDTFDLTPAQVDRWHVLYETLPEAAIDGTELYTFLPSSQDSLKEGATLQFAVDVKNISHLPMDSLLINYWIVNQNQNIVPIPYDRQDSLRVGATLRDTIEISTAGLVGNNTLWMEVNPYIGGVNLQYKDQPELAHFNNVLQLPFTIESDDINPILDVTFDGLHILNGDIINPNSEIVITLKDNNPFLVMNQDADTSLFGIYLKDPLGNQSRIPFIDGNGQQIMFWEPADNDNLKFKIIFPARFEEEGEYELLVQGADKSGNLSGDLEYRVKFEVILASSITYMMNYPNPFSTKTRFVFTLTGTEVPDELIIQIMTVTGRIVREISQDEIGPIRIGRNISEYAWDGRDEFGDQLANGVYLYRVNARINGESIDHRSSGADQFFKRNWGKMYLMR